MLYKRPKRQNSILVDLSPLIDVVFLLLIFFMVSTRFKDDHGMDLALPKSESRQEATGEFLTVMIDKEGTIRIGDDLIKEAELKAAIEARLPNFESKTVILKVDQEINHGLVVSVMDAAKGAGADGITFATASKPQGKP